MAYTLYAPTDADRIQAIRAAAFAPVFASFRDIVGSALAPVLFGDADVSQARYVSSLCKLEERKQVFVVETQGIVVGFMHLSLSKEKSLGAIGLNAVNPTYSGQGMGTALYQFALNYFVSQGMKAAKVVTGGDRGHAPARKAYEKANFDITLPTVTYYKDLLCHPPKNDPSRT